MRLQVLRDLARTLAAAAALLAAAGVSLAQVFVNSTVVATTISVTNTFQSIQAAQAVSGAAPRRGCTIQNNGTHVMYVFFGPIASATTSNTFQVAAGQSINCGAFPGIVLQDQISITGTSGDAFVATLQ